MVLYSSLRNYSPAKLCKNPSKNNDRKLIEYVFFFQIFYLCVVNLTLECFVSFGYLRFTSNDHTARNSPLQTLSILLKCTFPGHIACTGIPDKNWCFFREKSRDPGIFRIFNKTYIIFPENEAKISIILCFYNEIYQE